LSHSLKFLQHLAHPDGNIALLNDSAFGIYNKPEELTSYSNKLLGQTVHQTNLVKPGLFALPDAGYYGVHTEDGSYLICDAAPIGPDYIPGHAHSDIFSFELSLRGHRVIVDSGVYDYEISRMRQYCRSTKAHNTVEIAAQDQCEMWSAFRVARRGRPYDVKWLPNKSGFRLSAWHDGYRRLKGSPVHHREFIWNNPGDFTIKDTISATRTQTVISRLHLHPDCKIDQLKNNTAWITYPAGKFKIAFWGNGRLVIEDSYYCPEFGLKIVNQALAFSLTGLKIKAVIRIEGC